jgi:ribose 5-phosphate isomerase B
MSLPLAIASDHAGYQLKNEIIGYLAGQDIALRDLGPYDGQVADYPPMARRVAHFVQNHYQGMGILVCGSAIGMCIAANRFPGVRAILAPTVEYARLGRSHNDGNVLCLGGRLTSHSLALEIVDVFLKTEFEGGRHQARVDMLDKLDML